MGVVAEKALLERHNQNSTRVSNKFYKFDSGKRILRLYRLNRSVGRKVGRFVPTNVAWGPTIKTSLPHPLASPLFTFEPKPVH